MNDGLFDNYKHVIAKVDDFCRQVLAEHREHILCAHGCIACCKQDLHLLPLEWHFLSRTLRARAETPGAADKGTPGGHACVLLVRGGCLLYAQRPVICRTHGLPLLVQDGGGLRRVCCEKNFRGSALDRLPAGSLLHLERLNILLVTVNRMFCAATGTDPGRRIPISALAR